MRTRIGTVVICILTAVWLARTPDWEPLIAFLVAFGSYLGVEFSQRPKEEKNDCDSHAQPKPEPAVEIVKIEPAPLEDEAVFSEGIEFKRSKRKAMKWVPFCTRCHQPVVTHANPHFPLRCADEGCSWRSSVSTEFLPIIMSRLPK